MQRLLAAAALLPVAHGLNAVPISDTGFTVEWIGNYTNLTHAAYASLSEELPGKLLLTRFGAAPFFGKSQVTLMDISSGSFTDVATNIDWPNVATVVDKSVFGYKAALVGAGFLVPSHTTGGIWVVDLENGSEPVKITKDKKGWKPDSGWFYHQADLMDMNGDGLLDVVTSRCAFSVEPFNRKAGELMWLEQPKTGALSGEPWVEHFIQEGPDFLFELVPKSAGPEVKGCAAEYIGEKLVYVFGSEKDGYKQRIVDSELGNGFGCTWVDLNGDGQLDLLATNHLNKNGSVFGYTWSGDLADNNTKVEKFVLATGFSAVSDAQGTASPGDAIPFYPRAGEKTGKPLILVSADNGNAFYVLSPDSQDPTNMNYKSQFIEYVGADVGRIAIGDTDGDGMNELFLPAYDLGQVVHYKIGKSDALLSPIVV